MVLESTKTRRGKRSNRKTRKSRIGRKVRGGFNVTNLIRSGISSVIGLRKLTEEDFEESFTAIRKPVNFALYTLTYTNNPEQIKISFKEAGNNAPGKDSLFNTNKVKILTGIKELLEAGNVTSVPNVDDNTTSNPLNELTTLLDKTNPETIKIFNNFTRQDLPRLIPDFTISERYINNVKTLLQREDTGRQQYFLVTKTLAQN